MIATAFFVASSFGLQAALLAQWNCDESNGTVLHDSGGTYNGNLSSGATFVAGGISGNALKISMATNGYVNMGNIFPMGNTDFSIVAWVKATGGLTGDFSHIVTRHEAFSRNGYTLSLTWPGTGVNYNKAALTAGDTGGAAYSTTTINDGVWHQLVGVYKTNGVKMIYVDGAPVEGTGAFQTISPNNATFMIGGVYFNGVPTGRFTGLVDEVQVYNHALNSSEVDYLFQNPAAVSLGCPFISSFFPLIARPGESVTIAGNNFSTTPADNVVYFGAVRAVVTQATVSSLTVITPSGAIYGPITVTVNGLTAASSKRFTPTFPGNGTFNTTSYAARIPFTAGANTVGTDTGDLDNDGKPEVVAANYGTTTVSVYQNQAVAGIFTSNSLAPKVDWPVGLNPRYVTVADVDNDGKLDVVAANHSGQSLSIYRNTTTGNTVSFAPRVDFATGTTPYRVSVGDLDGDGKQDLVVANAGSSTVSVLRNLSVPGVINSNSFAAKVDFVTGSTPERVIIADLDGDGRPDLASANDYGASVSILRNLISTPGPITNGSFAFRVDLTAASRPQTIVAGDFDNDGKLDLAVGTYSGASISVFKNQSTSGFLSFAARFDLPTGGSTHDLALGDLDGNGKVDLVAVSEYSEKAAVYRNVSTNGILVAGSFAARVDFPCGHNPAGVSVSDLDADGRPEIVAGNYDGIVSVLKNLVPISGQPSISQQPASLSVISGQNAVFTVTANGASPLKYRWRKNGTPLVNGGNITGATNAALTVSAVDASDAGQYSVIVSNNVGSVISSNATLTVLFAPVITAQPISQIVPLGGSASFNVVAAGTAPLAYQWKKNGAVLPGATDPTLTFVNVQTANVGTYTVVVSNIVDAVESAPATLEIGVPPSIVAQPVSQKVYAHSTAAFSVIADGALPLRYQWRFNGDDISGATDAQLVLPNVPFSAAGTYDVVVRNPVGVVTSSPASLTVQLRSSDFNEDGQPDILWEHPSGAVAAWLMDNTNILRSVYLQQLAVPSGWRIVAQGDFNQDGASDLVLQHQKVGYVRIWLLDGTNVLAKCELPRRTMPTGWRVAGVNDFDGDSKPDILWQHPNHNLAISLMDGTNVTSSVYLGAGPQMPRGSKLVALLDLNSDGQKDFLWQQANAKTVVWYMNGTNFVSTAPITFPNTPSKARIVGSADFDTNGQDDVLWQASSGAVTLSLLSGTNTTQTVRLNSGKPVGPGWAVVGPK